MLPVAEGKDKSERMSHSESKSEKVSKDGKPPNVDAAKLLKGLDRGSGLMALVSPFKNNLCSSSSPVHNVGSGGNDPTISWK